MKELKTYFSMDPRLMHPMIYIFIFYLIFFFPFCGGEGSYVPVCVHTAEKKHIKKLLVYRQQKKCVSSWDFCATFVQEVYKKPRQWREEGTNISSLEEREEEEVSKYVYVKEL